MTISDEELAKIAWTAWGDGFPGDNGDDLRESDEPDEFALSVWNDPTACLRPMWLGVARAVRAALTEPVTPLAPGETVTITNVFREPVVLSLERGRFLNDAEEVVLEIGMDGFTDPRFAADGVRALRDTCDRWLAGQAGDDDE